MKQVVGKWRKAIRKANSTTIFKRAILENKELILDSNIAQLRKGKDSFGDFLEEYASDDYAQMKIAMGSQAPFGKPDLILEGDFTEGFILKYQGGAFFFDSTDEKRNHLVDKYGEGLFGLSFEEATEITPDIAHTFIKLFRNELL